MYTIPSCVIFDALELAHCCNTVRPIAFHLSMWVERLAFDVTRAHDGCTGRSRCILVSDVPQGPAGLRPAPLSSLGALRLQSGEASMSFVAEYDSGNPFLTEPISDTDCVGSASIRGWSAVDANI